VKLTKSQLKELIRNSIRSVVSEEDDDKYTHIGYGKYKEKGKEKDKSAPTFKKDDSGKFVPFKSKEKMVRNAAGDMVPASTVAGHPDFKKDDKPHPGERDPSVRKSREKPTKTAKIKADPFDPEKPDDEPPFKGGKPTKDDDSEYDVGGPSYPKVPKGVKTSADAKGVMKARDLAKQSMDAADAANLKMQQDVLDSTAKDIGYDDAGSLVMFGMADEIGELLDHDDVYESIPDDLVDSINNSLDFIRDNEQGVRDDSTDMVDNARDKILKMIQNPNIDAKEDKPKDEPKDKRRDVYPEDKLSPLQKKYKDLGKEISATFMSSNTYAEDVFKKLPKDEAENLLDYMEDGAKKMHSMRIDNESITGEAQEASYALNKDLIAMRDGEMDWQKNEKDYKIGEEMWLDYKALKGERTDSGGKRTGYFGDRKSNLDKIPLEPTPKPEIGDIDNDGQYLKQQIKIIKTLSEKYPKQAKVLKPKLKDLVEKTKQHMDSYYELKQLESKYGFDAYDAQNLKSMYVPHIHDSVNESKKRRFTVKEVRMWMKKLEENRYKKVYHSDARRVAWMVNNEGVSLDEMPMSMKKKWSKAQYGRERYLAKEFLKSKSEQLAEQKLRKKIREIIKEAISHTQMRIIYVPKKDMKKAIKVVKSMPFKLKGKVEIDKNPSDKVRNHYRIITTKQLFDSVVEYLAGARIGVKTISKGKM